MKKYRFRLIKRLSHFVDVVKIDVHGLTATECLKMIKDNLETGFNIEVTIEEIN